MKNLNQKIVVSALFVILFSISFTFAQENAPEFSKQCNTDVARSLVVSQVDDSKTVEESDKRIKILLKTADFLWDFDEETARKQFIEALDLARERFKEKGLETKRGGKSLIIEQGEYRFRVLTAIAKRDAAWANKLTDEVLKETETENKTSDTDFNGDVGRLLDIAQNLLKVNKQTAFQFARRAAAIPLGKGGMRWHFFLYNAADVDQQAADRLYSELLSLQRNVKSSELVFLSGYPFGNQSTYGMSNSSVAMNVSPKFVPNPALQRQFLNVLIESTLALQPETEAPAAEKWRFPESSVALSALMDLEPIVIERFPDLLPRLSAAKAHANSLMTAAQNSDFAARLKTRESGRAGFEKKLEDLEKETDANKFDSMIVSLVFAAKSDEQLAKAAEWLIKISDENVRSATTNYLYFRRSELASKENRLADAEKFADKVSQFEHRAVLYFRIAEARLKSENDNLRAAEALETVVKSALKAPDGVERAQVLLGAAFWFEKYNPVRAAEVLSEAVKTINRLENPDISSTTLHQKIEGKNFNYYAGYSTPGFSVEKSFEAVAKRDFQGALIQARNLNDKYLRTLAVISAVADCAAEENKKPVQKPVNKKKT